MSKRYGWRLGVLLALGAMAGSGSAARAAEPGPQLWRERGANAGRVYTDGERAIGGLRQGNLDVTFLGVTSREKRDYSGKVTGLWRDRSGQRAIAGSWRLNMDGVARRAVLRIPAGEANLDLADPEVPPVLRCGWARGSVSRHRSGQQMGSLGMGDAIAAGDTVTTGPQSAAILVLGDRSVAVMMESTTLVLPAGTYNPGSTVQRVRMQGGKIWFAVRKLGSGEKFEVETGARLASVRGTEFVVTEDAREQSITMADGDVDLTDLAGVQPRIPVPATRRWRLAAGAQGPGQLENANLQALTDEWNELLELADYCWPFRREARNPFWQDKVDPPRRRPVGKQDPFVLGPLVWEGVRQATQEDPVVREGPRRAKQEAPKEEARNRNDGDDRDDNEDRDKKRQRRQLNRQIGGAVGGLVGGFLSGRLGGGGGRGGGGSQGHGGGYKPSGRR